jgi:hypothetical protein
MYFGLLNAMKRCRATITSYVGMLNQIRTLVLTLFSNEVKISSTSMIRIGDIEDVAWGSSSDLSVSLDTVMKIKTRFYSYLLTSEFMTQEELDSLTQKNAMIAFFGDDLKLRYERAIKNLKEKTELRYYKLNIDKE